MDRKLKKATPMAVERTFSDLFIDPDPSFAVSFSASGDEVPLIVKLKSKLGSSIGYFGRRYLNSTFTGTSLQSFNDFYCAYNGAVLFSPYGQLNCHEIPVLTMVPASDITSFTKEYLLGGKLAWIMDLNKSKTLYRGHDRWVAFAKVGNGPSCLTIFLDGQNAGRIFLAVPQPRFNILKPIAQSFDLLLGRIAKDPAAFARLVGAYVSFRKPDGYNYGYSAVKYYSGLE